MRVGIVNFHCAHNYGAMLQAYALQETIYKLGYDVKIIDFQPDAITKGYKIWTMDKLLYPRILAGTIKNYKKLKVKYDVFEDFKNDKFKLTKTYKELNNKFNETEKFDVLICGSDQVWNMDLNGGLTEYLLGFCDDKNVKKISYAASIGTKKLSEKNAKLMEPYIREFDSISVRESDAVKVIKENFNLESTQVLDPVFLLDKSEWEEIANIPKAIEGEYVLLYGLEGNELFEKTFKFIKEKTNMKIINISPVKNKSPYIDENLFNVGPKELIGLLMGANTVFTNSFHGTCFSIIFEKNFFVLGHSELNSRIESILNLTGLSKHMISKEFSSIEDFNKTITINNKDNLKSILRKEIENSKKFLIDSLDYNVEKEVN